MIMIMISYHKNYDDYYDYDLVSYKIMIMTSYHKKLMHVDGVYIANRLGTEKSKFRIP
jgi:hypothetical protein